MSHVIFSTGNLLSLETQVTTSIFPIHIFIRLHHAVVIIFGHIDVSVVNSINSFIMSA